MDSNLVMEKISILGITFAYGGLMTFLGLYAKIFSGQGFKGPLSVLAPWIQWTVLLAGVMLLCLFFYQLISALFGRNGSPPAHDHECPDHDHHHEHEHKHEHGETCMHDHGECGHDHVHGWSPIKFIPLVIPVLLSLMGLPSQAMIASYEQDLINQQTGGSHQNIPHDELAAGDPLRQVGCLALARSEHGVFYLLSSALAHIADVADEDPNAKPVVTNLAMLELIASNPIQREQWKKYKSVEVEGRFNPGAVQNGRYFFSVVQMRVACCLGDAVPALMFGTTKQPINIEGGAWIAVRGRLEFLPARDGSSYKPAIRVFHWEKRPMPAQPYLTN